MATAPPAICQIVPAERVAKGQPRQHGGLVQSSTEAWYRVQWRPNRLKTARADGARSAPLPQVRDSYSHVLQPHRRIGAPIVGCETRWSTCDAHIPGDLRLRRRYSADRSAGYQYGRSRQCDTSSCSVLVRGDADAQLTAGNVDAPLQGRGWAGPMVGGNGCGAGSCPA